MHAWRSVLAIGVLIAALVCVTWSTAAPDSAASGTAPVVSGMSRHAGPNWGDTPVTITGANFSGVTKVVFGSRQGYGIQVASPGKLTVFDPQHANGVVDVRVVTVAGSSAKTTRDHFTFRTPSWKYSQINNGWTVDQERAIDRTFQKRAHQLESVPVARRSARWTPAMGLSAARRAKAWVGLPYSWDGGVTDSPSDGACYRGSSWDGMYDCHVWGFDCSGLALYAWGRYTDLIHYAASQHSRAGRVHPAVADLEPGDLLFYSGGEGSTIGHVVIYLGHGQVVQAYESGHPIVVSPLSEMTAMAGHYFGATRPMSAAGQSGPAPRVTSISAPRVTTRGGTTLILHGRNLGSAASVIIAGRIVYGFHVLSAGAIEVTTPAHAAGSVSVRVGGPWSVSAASPAARFSYVAAPALTKLSATSGPTSGTGRITLTGSSFVDVHKVLFGTTPATGVQPKSGSRLSVVVPEHTAATVPVTVVTKYGTSRALTYTYVAPPTITTVTPATGSTAGGDTVTISGANFVEVQKVMFDNVPATFSVTASKLTVVTPAHVAGPVDVTVVTAYGTVVKPNEFAFTDPGSSSPPPASSRSTPASHAKARSGHR